LTISKFLPEQHEDCGAGTRRELITSITVNSCLLDQCRSKDMESVAALKVENLKKASLENEEQVVNVY